MKLAWETFIPDPLQRLSPAPAIFATPELSGMPPTLIITAEYERAPRRGRRLRDALLAAGVSPPWCTPLHGRHHGFARRLR
jgi:acetyl esterase